MTVFVKTMKMHYVLKGLDENPQTGITKKRAQQQKRAPFGGWWFRRRILIQSCWNVHRSQAKTSGRGQPRPTIINYKELIRFNNNNNNHLTRGPPVFSRPGDPHGEGFLPHLVGGIMDQRVSCSPHTQLSRPMPWGHHILEWRTTEHTKFDIELHRATVKLLQSCSLRSLENSCGAAVQLP